MFADQNIWNSLDKSKIPNVETVYSLDDFSLLKSDSQGLKEFVSNSSEYFAKKYEKGFL